MNQENSLAPPEKIEFFQSKAFTVSMIVGLAIWGLGPVIGTFLRDVDTIAVDFYSRYPLSDVWTMGHLRAERVHFYRPLSDFFDALMVQGFGYQPAAYHLCLLVVIVINGVLLASWVQSLCRGAGWLAGSLYVTHPFQPGTLSYFEGGSAHVTYLFFALAFVHAMIRFRRNRSPYALSLALCFLFAATLCFDGAVVFPVGWFILDRMGLAPDQVGKPEQVGNRERLSFKLAALFPMVLLLTFPLRKAVLGVFLGGYGTSPLALEDVDVYALAFLKVVGRVLYSGYDDLRALAPWPVLSSPMMLGLLLGLASFGLVFRATSTRKVFLSLTLLFIGLLAPASPDFVLDVIHQGDLQPNGAYRLSVPFALASAWIAVVVFGVFSRKRYVGFALGILLLSQSIGVSKPLRESCLEAGELAQKIRRGVSEKTDEAQQAPTTVLLFQTPVEIRVGSISTMRVLQYGLASSFMPPMASPGHPPVYPIHSGDQVLLRGTRAAFASLDDVLSLEAQKDGSVRRFIPKPDEAEVFSLGTPAPGEPIALGPPSDRFRSLHRDQASEDEMGASSFGFEVTWPLEGMLHSEFKIWPVVILLNSVTPFVFERHVGADYHLPIVVDQEQGLVRCFIAGPYLREVVNHSPDWPVYILVEGRDGHDRTRVHFRSRPIRVFLKDRE